MLVCDSIEGRNFRAGNCCCRVVNGLFTTVFFDDMCQRFSYSFDLHDLVGSTILKKIPTSSSGDTVVVEDPVFFSLYVFDKLRWITVGLQSCMNISILAFRSYPQFTLNQIFTQTTRKNSRCVILDFIAYPLFTLSSINTLTTVTNKAVKRKESQSAPSAFSVFATRVQ